MHRVFLENSDIRRLERKYRYLLPAVDLLETPARHTQNPDEPRVGLAKLGEELLSREWPVLELAQLRQNYILQLDRMNYVNGRGEVRMDALLQDIQSFYTRGFLENLGCRGPHWLVRMLRSNASLQQPIRHLLLVNYIGISLEDLLAPKPSPPLALVLPANLTCVNHLCPEHGRERSEFFGEERSAMLGGMVETYRCWTCGQVQARCYAGHERTWVRDYGDLWRDKLTALWANPALGLRAIASELRVSCDAVRKNALRLGLPLLRPGHRPLSVRSYGHLLVSREERRREKVEGLRKRWLDERKRCPDLAMRGLRKNLPAVYASLYRYDREWLMAHKPPRKTRDLVVNWDQRDRDLCKRIESVASQVQPVTPWKLARAAGMVGWISDRLSRLPRARQTLKRMTSNCRASRCSCANAAPAFQN